MISVLGLGVRFPAEGRVQAYFWLLGGAFPIVHDGPLRQNQTVFVQAACFLHAVLWWLNSIHAQIHHNLTTVMRRVIQY